MGFEPTLTAWKAVMLPLHHTHACPVTLTFFGGQTDSLHVSFTAVATRCCPNKRCQSKASGTLGENRTHITTGLSRRPLPVGIQGQNNPDLPFRQ